MLNIIKSSPVAEASTVLRSGCFMHACPSLRELKVAVPSGQGKRRDAMHAKIRPDCNFIRERIDWSFLHRLMIHGRKRNFHRSPPWPTYMRRCTKHIPFTGRRLPHGKEWARKRCVRFPALPTEMRSPFCSKACIDFIHSESSVFAKASNCSSQWLHG